MKNIILSCLLSLGLMYSASAASTSIVVLPGTMVNLLSVAGIAKVTSVAVTASVGTNVTVWFVDVTTNTLSSIVPQYSNTVSYLTNSALSIYTNYFGVTTTNPPASLVATYTHLVDITNVITSSVTNTARIPLIMSALANTTATSSGVNYYFDNGIWVTNASIATGIAAVTITYQQ